MAVFCAYFKENICRSCALITMSYDQQLAVKEDALRSAIGPVNLLPTVSSELTGFRNKAKIVVSGTLEDPVLGLLDREVLDCPVHDPVINRLLHDLIPFIKAAKLEPYSVPLRKGELKGIILFHGDETYVRFVLRSKEGLDRIRKHLPDFLQAHPHVRSVSVNIQPVHQAILEGDEEIHLGPQSSISQSYGSLKLQLRPQAFVQTNQKIAGRLYATAAEWVEETKSRKILELYCGQGAFTFHCAPFVEEATGVEINGEAVKVALSTARELRLSHLSFVSLDAGKAGSIISEKMPDLILVNPPRRGLAEAADLILDSSAEWILYSSCSVESLAVDVKKLSTVYRVEQAQLFDMFPHTAHFETLVLLRRVQR